MTEPQVPEGSVVITPSQIYEKMESIRDEVRHLSSVVDPALNEVRTGIAANATRIEQIRAERVEQFTALELRVRNMETRPVVTPSRMWSAIGILAAVASALVVVAVALNR